MGFRRECVAILLAHVPGDGHDFEIVVYQARWHWGDIVSGKLLHVVQLGELVLLVDVAEVDGVLSAVDRELDHCVVYEAELELMGSFSGESLN